ncbi:4495_t:CDS:1, partial [Paraglomus occultum]
ALCHPMWQWARTALIRAFFAILWIRASFIVNMSDSDTSSNYCYVRSIPSIPSSDITLPSISKAPFIPLNLNTSCSIVDTLDPYVLARIITDFKMSKYSDIRFIAEGEELFMEFNGIKQRSIRFSEESIMFRAKEEVGNNTRRKLDEDVR